MSLVPQLGMVELFVLAILALIVVGPKDLPRLMRTVGQTVNRVRKMAEDFKSGFDEMAREAEVEEMRREIEALKKETVDDTTLIKELRETSQAMENPVPSTGDRLPRSEGA
ncbi:hypothetical protein PB2503_07142 [Parvularcula bermudensis HTCC2503]|uniref:Sec-independent protein translocase protein TatB n=1 Tax=Parvularcula bermudensis (strain ATCC BAA-594 / HTCC2503 / KCTC 12087) TaxID=314260 RepID=E0TEB9_PARBH|nr:Sec-independent protein translocase protein TatB [Parvularcula bermudensis]ADM09494.1 hypothetical protein PB2503_07142 [Parvularcula bermudensis HTCC2503]